jgi:small-conductance mechanosensitive channel
MENDQDELARLRQQKDVRRALQQTGAAPPGGRVVGAGSKFALTSYVVLLVALGVLYYLISHEVLHFPYAWLVQRAAVGGVAAFLVLALARLVDAWLIGRVDDAGTQYNLRRMLGLVTRIMFALIVVEVLVANWYTAVVSLGLLSLILGFALQAPISSFIGWIFIVVRVPYRIGDRIRLGEAEGDVIDIGYLETTLWERGGQQVGPNSPSGRIIRFPNSHVLNSTIISYSWPLFPFVWNQVTVHVAYQSDLKFVARVMTEVAQEELGEGTAAQVALYRELLRGLQINEKDIQAGPVVTFRASENSWLEASVRYLVMPPNASEVRSRILQRIVEELNKAPERAMLPTGDSR